MEVKTIEELKKLSLQELKIMCSDYSLSRAGTRSELIKRIWEFIKPEPITLNRHQDINTPKGRKIIGIKLDETEKQKQIGLQREKGNVVTLYYSMGVNYYEVNKDFQFL